MKTKYLFALAVAAAVSVPAFAAGCGPNETKVVVTQNTVGAVDLDVFQHIVFDSAESVQQALADQKAHPISAGTTACQLLPDGFHVGSAHLKVAGQPFDYWVPYRTVRNVD
jgi:hypothetical protein